MNEAKIVLANNVTMLCRGRLAADQAAETASTTFAAVSAGRGSAKGSSSTNAVALPILDLPSAGLGIIEALVGLGFAASRGEAKRLVAGGGARVDGVAITAEGHHIAGGAELRISSGKKKHGILRPE